MVETITSSGPEGREFSSKVKPQIFGRNHAIHTCLSSFVILIVTTSQGPIQPPVLWEYVGKNHTYFKLDEFAVLYLFLFFLKKKKILCLHQSTRTTRHCEVYFLYLKLYHLTTAKFRLFTCLICFSEKKKVEMHRLFYLFYIPF